MAACQSEPARRPEPARTALVTGANRGLGRAAALALGQAGLAVGLLGRSDAGLRQVAGQIAAAGGRATCAVADVRDLVQVRAAVAGIEQRLGGTDLLVNNAGVIDAVEVPVWEADPDDWWDVVETDLRGPFHLVRAVVPGMVERGGGRVVDVSSGAGARDRDNYSAYTAAKAALFRIAGNLHLAGYERGLRSFEISPGTVLTEMTAAMGVHRNRTAWTPESAFTDLLAAVARGEVDDWSGCFLRADIDTPQSLARAAGRLEHDSAGALREPARRLTVAPWGPDDPLAGVPAPSDPPRRP